MESERTAQVNPGGPLLSYEPRNVATIGDNAIDLPDPLCYSGPANDWRDPMLGGIGAPELIVIFAIVLLLFGGKKLPEVAKSMGSAMRAFRDEANSLKREIDLEAEAEPSGSSSQRTQTSTAGAGEAGTATADASEESAGSSESDGESEAAREASEPSTTETHEDDDKTST